MKKLNLVLIALVMGTSLFAAPPADYYTSANTKSSETLRLALQDIIDGHTVVSYDNLNMLYIASDSHPDGSLWDMYSTCAWQHNQKKCGNYKVVCDCYNKEHSIPQSWFGSKSPMVSDAFHVYPTDGKVNGQRSNNPFGECTSGSILSSNALGRSGSSTFSGASGTVFEPVDEYKGDFARTYFYMATRYANKCESWGGQTFSTANSGLTNYAVALFLKWHRQDPVSEKERVRNDAIYGINNTTGFKQGNRNPFIDYPCLAEYVWGEKKGTAVDFDKILSTYSDAYSTTTDLSGCTCMPEVPTVITPKSGSSIMVGSASINESVTTHITVKGMLLTQNLSLSISGTNASLFTVLPTTVTSANALAGTTVTVSYKPTALGNHTATLTINSTELAAPTTVTLTGSCAASLVSPTTNELLFSSYSVAVKNDQTVLIKGTNLTSQVNLSLAGTNASLFKLSSTSVSASDVNAGKNITLSYSPTAVGNHTATLVVKSNDFTTVNVPLVGTCLFEALDATNVTKNSFNANWTNAGVSDYVLDVFTQTIVGGASVPILEDVCNKSTTATTSGGVYNDIDSCMRLGSSSKLGSLTYSGLDLSAGGSVVVNAQYYSKDAGTQMKVTAGSISQTFVLTSSFDDYTLTFDANPANTSASVVIESLANSKRVNVNNVKISAGGETIENTSLAGYPKSVGNVQTYLVVGLETNTPYYYTVTPTSIPVSEEISVVTLENDTPTDMQYTDAHALVYYTTSEAVQVLNLQPGSSVMVFDTMGRLCAQRTNCATEETFILPQGVYLFKVAINGHVQSVKVVR